MRKFRRETIALSFAFQALASIASGDGIQLQSGGNAALEWRIVAGKLMLTREESAPAEKIARETESSSRGVLADLTAAPKPDSSDDPAMTAASNVTWRLEDGKPISVFKEEKATRREARTAADIPSAPHARIRKPVFKSARIKREELKDNKVLGPRETEGIILSPEFYE